MDQGGCMGAQCIRQGIRHIRMCLKMTWTDARSDSGLDLLRFAAVSGHHRFYRFFGNSCGSSPPTGMDSGNDPLNRVIEQNWNTVGRKNSKTQTGLIRHQSVGLYDAGGGQIRLNILGIDRTDQSTVYLAVFNDSITIRADGGAKATKIFGNRFFAISAICTQI